VSLGRLLSEKKLLEELELVKQGIGITTGLGIGGMEGLGRMALLVGLNVYEFGSLKPTGEGVTFTLRNPPLRMGAFSAIRAFWDKVQVPPTMLQVSVRGSPTATRADRIDRDHPFTIPVGKRTDFRLDIGAAVPGPHHVRLELQSVAIPPLVFFEFTDPLKTEA
jgi:hypothetical protein